MKTFYKNIPNRKKVLQHNYESSKTEYKLLLYKLIVGYIFISDLELQLCFNCFFFWSNFTPPHSWNPPFLPVPFQKLSHLGGRGRNFLLEREDKPVNGGSWCWNGGLPPFLLLYSSIIFTICEESKVPFITFWIFSLLS